MYLPIYMYMYLLIIHVFLTILSCDNNIITIYSTSSFSLNLFVIHVSVYKSYLSPLFIFLKLLLVGILMYKRYLCHMWLIHFHWKHVVWMDPELMVWEFQFMCLVGQTHLFFFQFTFLIVIDSTVILCKSHFFLYLC